MYVCLCAQITLQNEKVKTISTVKYLHMKVVNGRESDNKVSSFVEFCQAWNYPLCYKVLGA